jgi:hypothetical protein
MKCIECNFEGPVDKFHYLYNVRIYASLSMFQCPNCQALLAIIKYIDKDGHECSYPKYRRSMRQLQDK